ncbi:histidine phosphatase family protein [Cetobacterium sp. SF1]|uniref:histidine phosphatase family protein n=1 Tax=Cetobacterium sp. SF1 TaxID=3417654 RepID=UPI003CF6E743
MGKLILVRHGETKMNAQGIYFGHLDPELNLLGKEQAKETRKILEKLNFNYDFLYTSDLKRAYETAEILNYNKKNIILAQELREINFGIFEGFSYEELKLKYPDELTKCEKNWEDYNYLTGESVKELQNRSVEFIKNNLDLNKINIVVTHWGVINTLLSYYFSNGLESYWKYSVNNGGIVIIEFSNGFPILKGLNIGG